MSLYFLKVYEVKKYKAGLKKLRQTKPTNTAAAGAWMGLAKLFWRTRLYKSET